MPESFYRGYVSPPTLEEISRGVFAYLHADGSWGLSNSGFVADGGDVAVIDSLLTEARSRALRDQVEQTAGCLPRILINTHHHNDHTFGNFVFNEALIVGHEKCREAVIETGLAPINRDPAVPWGAIRITPPQMLFEDKLALYIGDVLVQLIYVGPAHTNNDVVAWLPEQRVLFAGDVLFNQATPLIVEGSLRGSVMALEQLALLEPIVIIPGHGPVCGTEALDRELTYLSFLEDLAKRAIAADSSPLETARSVSLGEFTDWQHPERIVMNLHRAVAELCGRQPGTKLDYDAIFDEMLQLNPRAYGHRIVRGREEYVSRGLDNSTS